MVPYQYPSLSLKSGLIWEAQEGVQGWKRPSPLSSWNTDEGAPYITSDCGLAFSALTLSANSPLRLMNSTFTPVSFSNSSATNSSMDSPCVEYTTTLSSSLAAKDTEAKNATEKTAKTVKDNNLVRKPLFISNS